MEIVVGQQRRRIRGDDAKEEDREREREGGGGQKENFTFFIYNNTIL